jgi:hypothetical protein
VSRRRASWSKHALVCTVPLIILDHFPGSFVCSVNCPWCYIGSKRLKNALEDPEVKAYPFKFELVRPGLDSISLVAHVPSPELFARDSIINRVLHRKMVFPHGHSDC